MIDVLLTLVLVSVFILIFWQDTKDRLVYWFLYTIVGILAFILNARSVAIVQAVVNTAFNLALVALIVAISFLYSRIIMRKGFLNESIGSGDLLFFICLAFTFSPVAFIILFVFSLIFSLVLHVSLHKSHTETTVPLAGYIALFFAVVYVIALFIEPRYLFA